MDHMNLLLLNQWLNEYWELIYSNQSANYLTFAGGLPLSAASISEMSLFLWFFSDYAYATSHNASVLIKWWNNPDSSGVSYQIISPPSVLI